MGKRCPKCNYVAQDDTAATCPACGVVYAKVEAAARRFQSTSVLESRPLGPLPDLPPAPSPQAAAFIRKRTGGAGHVTLIVVGIIAFLIAVLATLFGPAILAAIYFLIFTVALTGVVIADAVYSR